MKKNVYLDYNATTHVDKRVLEAMLPYFTNEFANAASNHDFGKSIKKSVENARQKVAELISANANEIIFTSGATEAINLAIKGLAEYNFNERKHIITSQTEHKAVLDVCQYLETKGFQITYLPVSNDGQISLDELKAAIKEDTILISIMYVNNETGVIQNIQEIAELAEKSNCFFMTDATQAVGKRNLNVKELKVDLMSLSGHKFYGPKGIGALYVNRSKVNLIPLLHGGGHEFGLRSGTLNVPAIIGFGKACEIALNEIIENEAKIRILRNHFESELLNFNNIFINGNKNNRLFNVANILFKNIDPDFFKAQLNNIAFSNGSACTSKLIQPSHVLKAMGLTDKEALQSFRFSFGKNNTQEEIEYVLNEIKSVILTANKLELN